MSEPHVLHGAEAERLLEAVGLGDKRVRNLSFHFGVDSVSVLKAEIQLEPDQVEQVGDYFASRQFELHEVSDSPVLLDEGQPALGIVDTSHLGNEEYRTAAGNPNQDKSSWLDRPAGKGIPGMD